MVELRRIKLKGFKSIREMDLELRDLNVLIGANGSGKSNFVSFLALLKALFARKLVDHVRLSGGADLLLHFGRKTTDSISCELLFACGKYMFAMRPEMRGDFVIFDEDPDFPPVHPYASGGHSLEARYLDPADYQDAPSAQELIRNSERWRVYHFHDTSESSKVKQTCDIHDNTFLRPDGANLSSILYLLQERYKEHYRNVVDAVRMIAPFFDEFELRPSELNELKIRLQWREKGSDKYFGPESLSDGTLRFICLATLLLQPKLPSLIIIDEPELGLHPSAIELVAELLERASVKSQVIVCTESVTLVNQFGPSDIVVVDREEGPSTFRRLTVEETERWLDRYGLGELWEKNIIGGGP